MICTCDLIYICHAGKLLHADRDVAALAENLLLCGGRAAVDYLSWAKTMFDGRLRARIADHLGSLSSGRVNLRMPWPALHACLDLLDSADEVVATMAAQCLMLTKDLAGPRSPDQQTQIDVLLSEAARRPWHLRYA